jgi:hypothetical protein
MAYDDKGSSFVPRTTYDWYIQPAMPDREPVTDPSWLSIVLETFLYISQHKVNLLSGHVVLDVYATARSYSL